MIEAFQNNRYHTQDVLGSACAATLVMLASKYTQQITNLTAFATATNGASVLITAKSIHTLCTSSKAGEKATAENTLVFALSVATVATMLRATTVLNSRHNAFPDFNKFAKPLFATTTATIVLTQGGIQSVKMAHSTCQAWAHDRAEFLALAKVEIAKEDFNTKEKIDALDAEAINALRGHIERVLASPADRNGVPNNLILWVNTRAGAGQLEIAGWENISRDLGMLDLMLEGGYFAKDIIIGIHDNIFQCVPVELQGGAPRERDDLLARFLDKWFPNEIQLVPGDSAAVMIDELGKLDGEEFKIIIVAFNRATEKSLSEETTPAQLIQEHLEAVVTLERDAFEGHEKLIRPYGLHQRNFEQDLGLLPDDVRRELGRNIPEESSMDAYYKDRMLILKEMIIALCGI
ncbi:hypothetical protein [Candidatus Neptunichlamydia sp. REUL1]|uniref:hypothetical protein n=1 Tax=Candidatus Neptunichlamydia sp. REUL1 TaxID=3064277 RepID=UPI00292EFACD|nr:hypothetical protein [Candidatus Neptunochlamydia sp. REUL1]